MAARPRATRARGADESDTGDDDSTGSGDGSEDGSSGSSDTGQGEACVLGNETDFSMEWSFGDYAPPQVGYADDGLDMVCVVDDFSEDGASLDLTLACVVDGDVIPTQAASLSPPPPALSQALVDGDMISLQFRAQQSCPNGCNYDGDGWLAVNDPSGALLFAHVEGRENADALTELFDPLTIETAESDCAPVFDGLCEAGEADGFLTSLDVTVSMGDESLVITDSGEGALGQYLLEVDRASAGAVGDCESDGGHRGTLRMRIDRNP